MENPFGCVTAIRTPEHLVGRRYVFNDIFSALQCQQNVALIGTRRIGKTSLLNCLANPEIQQQCKFDGSHFLFLSLDLRERALKVRVDFFEEVCKVLREQGQRLGFVPAERLDRDDELDALLDEFKQHNLYPVLVMDAFDEIARYRPVGEEIFGFLRPMASQGRISYITASMKASGEMLGESVSSKTDSNRSFGLHRLQEEYHIGPLTIEEAHQLLREPSERVGMPFSEEEVEWILSLAGRHPYLLQRAAYALFAEKQKERNVREKRNQIRHQIYLDLKPYFEEVWESLSQQERTQLMDNIQKERRVAQPFPEFSESYLFRIYVCQKRQITIPESLAAVDTILNRFGIRDTPLQLRKAATIGSIRVNFLYREAIIESQTVHLTPIESKLLHILAINANRVCTDHQIIAHIWRESKGENADVIKAHIRRLRQKIERDPRYPTYILTVPGVGYTLTYQHEAEEYHHVTGKNRGVSAIRAQIYSRLSESDFAPPLYIDDLVQEVLDSYDQYVKENPAAAEKAEAYLIRITDNICKRFLRRLKEQRAFLETPFANRKEKRALLDSLAEEKDLPEEMLLHPEIQEQIDRAIGQLPQPLQRVMRLYVRSVSSQDIAKETDQTVSTVHRHIQKGLKQLRVALAEGKE